MPYWKTYAVLASTLIFAKVCIKMQNPRVLGGQVWTWHFHTFNIQDGGQSPSLSVGLYGQEFWGTLVTLYTAVIFDIRVLLVTLGPDRQSARMSKITNDGLTRSGTHTMLYSSTYMATVGVKGLINVCTLVIWRRYTHGSRRTTSFRCLPRNRTASHWLPSPVMKSPTRSRSFRASRRWWVWVWALCC